MGARAPILRSLAAGLGAAVVISLVVTLAQERPALVHFGIGMAVGVSHAVLIGVPAGIVFPIARRRLTGRSALAQWSAYLALLFGLTVVGSGAAALLLVAVGVFDAHSYAERFVPAVACTFGVGLLLGLGAAGYEGLRERLSRASHELHAKELEHARALAQAAEARLASLESRIRPHFLFNALNAALALIPDDAGAAERVLERVASLLRSSLDAGVGGLVPLEREMAMVVDYLEIERVRFGDRLTTEIDVQSPAASALVPPFAVQTLVENSVKYAVGARPSGATVRVQGRREGDRVVVVVSDDGPGFAWSAAVPGHGLHSLRTRVATLFGEGGTLTLERAPAGGSVVTLALPATTETA